MSFYFIKWLWHSENRRHLDWVRFRNKTHHKYYTVTDSLSHPACFVSVVSPIVLEYRQMTVINVALIDLMERFNSFWLMFERSIICSYEVKNIAFKSMRCDFCLVCWSRILLVDPVLSIEESIV